MSPQSEQKTLDLAVPLLFGSPAVRPAFLIRGFAPPPHGGLAISGKGASCYVLLCSCHDDGANGMPQYGSALQVASEQSDTDDAWNLGSLNSAAGPVNSSVTRPA